MWSEIVKKKVLFFTVFFLIIMALITCLVFYKDIKQAKKVSYKALGYDNLKKIENKCISEKNYESCFYLLEKYSFINKYDKASHYGEYCLKYMPKENKSDKFIVHLYLAKVYYNKDNLCEACYHLEESLKKDSRKIIKKKNWISLLEIKKLKRVCLDFQE